MEQRINNTNEANTTKEEKNMNTNYTYARLYLDCECVAYDILDTIHDYYQAAPIYCGELFINIVAYDPNYPCFIDSWFKHSIEEHLRSTEELTYDMFIKDESDDPEDLPF